MFFSSFFKQPVEVFCCTIFDKSLFVSLVLFCSVEAPRGPCSWKDRGNAHNQDGVEKAVCGGVWLDWHKLRAVTSPGSLSVSLVSQWEFCTSRKEGIGLWLCRSAWCCLCSSPWPWVGVQCIQSSEWAGKNRVQECPAQKFEHLATSFFLELFIVIISESKLSTRY